MQDYTKQDPCCRSSGRGWYRGNRGSFHRSNRGRGGMMIPYRHYGSDQDNALSERPMASMSHTQRASYDNNARDCQSSIDIENVQSMKPTRGLKPVSKYAKYSYISRQLGVDGVNLLSDWNEQEQLFAMLKQDVEPLQLFSTQCPVVHSVHKQQDEIQAAFRKLREALVSTDRMDEFAVQVYEYSILLSILLKEKNEMVKALSTLVNTLYNLQTDNGHHRRPMFTTLHMIQLATTSSSHLPVLEFYHQLPEEIRNSSQVTSAMCLFKAIRLRHWVNVRECVRELYSSNSPCGWAFRMVMEDLLQTFQRTLTRMVSRVYYSLTLATLRDMLLDVMPNGRVDETNQEVGVPDLIVAKNEQHQDICMNILGDIFGQEWIKTHVVGSSRATLVNHDEREDAAAVVYFKRPKR